MPSNKIQESKTNKAKTTLNKKLVTLTSAAWPKQKKEKNLEHNRFVRDDDAQQHS